MPFDFTLKKYENLLKILKEKNIKVFGVKDWVEKNPDKGVLIRHDVDRRPRNSLKTAKLEAVYNIFTTYYFRIKKHTFKPKLIKKIAELGHEIGYHYENLSDCRGDYQKAIKDFDKNLKKFREITDIKTIAMHGKPLSRYKNDLLWEKYDYRKYDILAEAFNTVDYTNTYYLTDTGRSWTVDKNNLRDKVNTRLKTNVNTTEELIKFINKDMKIAIVIHPERWNDDIFSWTYSYLSDNLANLAKIIIKGIRK